MDIQKEPEDRPVYIELSTARPDGQIDPEIQAISIEFASRGSEWHKQETKRLVWKIDVHLLPWIVLMYLTNFLDRKWVIPFI
jgi:hypothetical protein